MKKAPIVLAVILAAIVLVYSGTLKQTENKIAPSSLTQQPSDPSIDAAQAHINSGDLVSAESILLKGLGADEFNERKYFLLSFIYVKSGDFTEAFKYAKPLADKSSDPQILTDLGSLFAMAGYDKMALVCYSKALNVQQGHIPAYIELGKLYGNQNKFIQAISVWQDGLRIEPDNQQLLELIKQANAIWQEQGQAQE